MDIAQEQMKQNIAKEAIKLVPANKIIGIGTGTTVNYFIKELAKIKSKILGTVASSKATESLLKRYKLPVYNLNTVDNVAIYFDGADSFNNHKQLIKGGGGALTREKILAAASDQFICLVDETKGPQILGKFPVAIEVIPMARSLVGRNIVSLGGQPVYRDHFVTDNGNIIIDVYNWEIEKPIELEEKLNNIPGVVENGIFAKVTPSKILVARKDGSTYFFKRENS